jgi:hypothetical protein
VRQAVIGLPPLWNVGGESGLAHGRQVFAHLEHEIKEEISV